MTILQKTTTNNNMETEHLLAQNFWGRIDNLLKSKNMSLRKLCLENDIAYQTVINQKCSARLPDIQLALKIVTILDSSIEYLVYGKPANIQENLVHINEALLQNDKLFAIAESLTQLDEEELNAIQLLLQRKG